MKLGGRDGKAFIASPSTDTALILLYGGDAMRVDESRARLLESLVGAAAADEMRLTRLPAAELRRDAARLDEATKERGFFPGARAVHLSEATDGLTDTIAQVLADWAPGDAQIVATAGILPTRSKLRKLAEQSDRAVSIGIYDDPPDRSDVERIAKSAGLGALDRDAVAALLEIGSAMGPVDMRQTIEKLALYKNGDTSPATGEDVAAMAPQRTEAGTDALIAAVADGEMSKIGPVLARLRSQGASPTSLCIDATRHFRTLFNLFADPKGPSNAVTRLRPPVFGPRRDALLRQCRKWTMTSVGAALNMLIETDLELRSSASAPQMAQLERTLIRVARLAGR